MKHRDLSALLCIVFFALVSALAAPAQTKQEVVLWLSIKDSTRVGDFLAYLDAYPSGTFVALANQHLTELTRIRSHRYLISQSVMEPKFTDSTHTACIMPAHGLTQEHRGVFDKMYFYAELKGLRPGDELKVEFVPPNETGIPIDYEILPPDIPDVECYRFEQGVYATKGSKTGDYIIRVSVNRIDFGGVTITVR